MVEVVFCKVVFGEVCDVAGLDVGDVGGVEHYDVHFEGWSAELVVMVAVG